MAIWTYLKEHDRGKTNFHFEVAVDPVSYTHHPLEELKPHEEEENQERTIEEIAKDIPISSVMKRAEEEDAKREDLSVGDINPYTGHEYQSNSVRMHPSRIGYVQVYDSCLLYTSLLSSGQELE